jgi:hypothetical protein
VGGFDTSRSSSRTSNSSSSEYLNLPPTENDLWTLSESEEEDDDDEEDEAEESGVEESEKDLQVDSEPPESDGSVMLEFFKCMLDGTDVSPTVKEAIDGVMNGIAIQLDSVE